MRALGERRGAGAMAEDCPMPRFLLTSLLAAALLALPATASAADTLVVPDPAAQQITALDGAVAWVSGTFGNQTLMLRTSDGTISAVKGAPASRNYRSIDLGRSRSNTLVLTYLRCDRGRPCKPISDDLAGHRATFAKLTRPRLHGERRAVAVAPPDRLRAVLHRLGGEPQAQRAVRQDRRPVAACACRSRRTP